MSKRTIANIVVILALIAVWAGAQDNGDRDSQPGTYMLYQFNYRFGDAVTRQWEDRVEVFRINTTTGATDTYVSRRISEGVFSTGWSRIPESVTQQDYRVQEP